MASEGDCELTSSVAHPSSGSLPGDKTTGEGTSIQHTASSGQDNQPQISVAENEGSIQNTASSGQKSQPQTSVSENKINAEFSVNMEKPEETKKARDINKSGEGLKHRDKADEEKGEDENQDQDIKAEVKKDHDASLKEMTTPTLSSPQPENDPHAEPGPLKNMDKEKINKPEKSEEANAEFSVNMEKPEETKKAREINESGKGLKHRDKADEEKGEDEDQDQVKNLEVEVKKDHDPSLKDSRIMASESRDGFKHKDEADEEKGEDEDQDQDINLEVEVKKNHDLSLKETTTPTLSSPQPENDPHAEPGPLKNMDKEKINKPEKSEEESRIMANESRDGLKRRDKADEEKGEDEDQDQDIKAEVKKDHDLRLKESRIMANESRDEFKHKDEADEEKGEDEDQDQDINLEVEVKKNHDLSLKETTTPTLSSPQPENDPHAEPGPLKNMDKEKINKPEKSEGANTESLDTMEKLEETKKSRDINESGDRLKHKDKADEEKGEDEGQDQDINLDAEAKQDHDPSLKEPLQHTATSGLPQERQPQTRVGGNDKLLWIGAFFVAILAYVVCRNLFFPVLTPPVPNEFNVVDVFNQNMKKLETSFPNQRPELWRRSLIHLRRHLKTERPTEPVSLILTSGHRAERTLGCLAQCLAQAFSTALHSNSSVLNINGTRKTSQNSDQVKLDIDRELRKAFEAETFAAVIHRFEELPPGSTLIFYRYCDHENAAYKNVFLAFTVMLDVEVPSSVGLGRVEEMVQEHVKQKFVSSDKLATFNEMDVDKLSGLWSRISHLILPVAAEETIERQGCADCDESF